jgi:hypothetical protein
MKLSLANLAPLKEIEFDSPAPEGMDIPNFDSLVKALKWKNDLENYSMDLEHELKLAQRKFNDLLSGQEERGAEPEGGPIQQKIAGELNQLKAREEELKQKLNTVLAKVDYFDQNYLSEGMRIGKNAYKTRTAINTAPGKTEDKEVTIYNIDDLNNITIGWKGANHHGNRSYDNLKFTQESEFDPDLMAISNDSKWIFIVDLDEETDEPDWDTLMVDNRELENVADDGTSTYSVPDEDMINEATEKSWNAIDVSRKAEKEIDNKEWNSRTTKKLDMLIALNKAGKFKKKEGWDEETLQGWVDKNYSWEDILDKMPKTKLKEAYFAMYEGSCGHGPNGVPGDTPGETQGMDADDRTRGMMRKLIQKEIAKLKKANEDYKPSHRAYNVIDKSDNDAIVFKELSRDRALEKAHTNPNYMIVATDKLAEEGENQSLDKKLKGTGIFSDEEWDKITNKPVPSFANMKPTDGYATTRPSRPEKF